MTAVRWALGRVGYWIRPYDMLADRRRWRWQARTKCGGVLIMEDLPRHRADTTVTRARRHPAAEHTPWWRTEVVPGVGSQPNADAAQPRPPTAYETLDISLEDDDEEAI
jgi:hypothetical protein